MYCNHLKKLNNKLQLQSIFEFAKNPNLNVLLKLLIVYFTLGGIRFFFVAWYNSFSEYFIKSALISKVKTGEKRILFNII